MKKEVAEFLAKVAEKAAVDAVCKASPWYKFQPRESAKVREWAKKKSGR